MRTTPFVLTLAAVGVTALSQAQASPYEPADRVIVDDSCYGQPHRERPQPMGSIQTRGYGSGGGGVSHNAQGGVPISKASGAAAPDAAPPPMAEAEASPARRTRDEDASVADGLLGAQLPAPVAEARDKAEAPYTERDHMMPPRHPGPRFDWGGTVHLSNDDSMSLASAQRLLYAVENGVRVTLDQIRKHELLNYFSFDTTQPRGSETFGVHASAERLDHDTLTLALAVQGASPKRSDLDLTLLVDRSGSMQAEGRMDYTKRALSRMTEQLKPGDRVDLVLFDHAVCSPLKNFVVGRDNPALLTRAIDRMQPRGSTNLDLGLKEAYATAVSHAGTSSRAGRVMVFTDALLNTGDVNPHTVSEIGRHLDDHNIRLTGVGVGRDFQDEVLNRLTEKGKGAYVFLGSERVVDRLFGRGFDALVQTIAEDVRFALHLPPSLGMETFYGEEMSTDAADIQPVNMQAGNSQLFLQELAIRPGTLRDTDRFTFDMSWTDPATGRRTGTSNTFTVGQAQSQDPHNVRKGRALMAWTDILTAKAMGQDACGSAFTTYRQLLPGLHGDAEIAYVSELIGTWCAFDTPVATWTAPAFTRIRLDADIDVTEVALSCPTGTQRQQVGASDTVARFETTPGRCQVTLYGAVPMTAQVEVPQTGADLRCVARAGRLACH